MFRVQKPLVDQTNKALKDAVLELARGLGRGTHRRVLKRLEHSATVPKELDDWLKLVTEEASKQSVMPSPPQSTGLRAQLKMIQPDVPVLLFEGIGNQTPFMVRFFDAYLRNGERYNDGPGEFES